MEQILKTWFYQISKEIELKEGLVAYNFGIFESSEGYGIYLAGSDSYDENDEDWACETPYQSQPLLLKNTLLEKMNWEDALDTLSREIKTILEETNLGKGVFSNKIVTIGFDDGNLTKLL